MKKLLLAAASILAILTSDPLSAQTMSNGPYYAIPSWDQQLPSNQRFIVLSNWNSEAVLDRETGLVWQRTPNNSPSKWADAVDTCRAVVKTGNRYGWRLPYAEELLSLIDPQQTFPALPPGHPFIGVSTSLGYWGANTRTSQGTLLAAAVNYFNGSFNLGYAVLSDSVHILSWCVRGGPGIQDMVE